MRGDSDGEHEDEVGTSHDDTDDASTRAAADREEPSTIVGKSEWYQ